MPSDETSSWGFLPLIVVLTFLKKVVSSSGDEVAKDDEGGKVAINKITLLDK